LGETRLVTKIGRADGSFTGEEKAKQYWYHSDHLGSAQLITNVEGEEYERIEYTPYGELWVERASAASNIDIPYRFTGKEKDEETGLYYYGARYLDPKYSRWLSTDPALSDYIPGAPINDEAKKRNGNLPGMGGVFNSVNLHLYHYAGNSPVKMKDPDGKAIETAWDAFNAALDITSMGANIVAGNYAEAALDLASLLYDGFATATPGLPGGTGSAKIITKLSAEYGDDAAQMVLKYSDDIAGLVFKAGNSRKLGNALEAAGNVRGANQAAHHIVAGGSRFAKEARGMLAKLGIDINDAANGVFLDKSKHVGLHTQKYYDMVTEALSGAKTKEDAVNILKDIADTLKN
jgi:RHS repeat-associated protein